LIGDRPAVRVDVQIRDEQRGQAAGNALGALGCRHALDAFDYYRLHR
jgi:hypothetical protein